MTILRPTFAALLFAVVSTPAAFAADPVTLTAVDARHEPRLVIGCGEHRLPTLASVGAVLDTNNASVIYGEREKLLHIAERECRRGHGEVVFVRDATAASALALVDARR